MLYGNPIQMFTRTRVSFASVGFESHGMFCVISWSCWRVLFIGPNVPFRRFAHTKSESICGIA